MKPGPKISTRQAPNARKNWRWRVHVSVASWRVQRQDHHDMLFYRKRQERINSLQMDENTHNYVRMQGFGGLPHKRSLKWVI